ncbi:DNA internalization-related competence protein ComEC/Rec2 [Vibrio sinaloensis]|uniref:DNA internalization-related competence protein ComEC/Rec2 n=1 Tax=Photobacterium sp. (strain ATCC 43367) TaxID=379097 RepID=UPI00205FAAC1|nr:DNA internalization-related competence protein ComEC/Rec2 [Vibrio sinaloensis]UPQ88907.1 DNA internalization-related competence protein ComEC/Rec2 [Vibrio sinaloensis]
MSAPLKLQPGEIVSAAVHLRPIVAKLNEVGFDGEQYALSTRVVGRASIKPKDSYYLLSTSGIRNQWIQTIAQATGDSQHTAEIRALLFGLRDEISSDTWLQLQQSGLSHLVAISGLHIGIAFSVGWALGLTLITFSPRLSWAPLVFGLALATVYAWLAGFLIPTQRALLMCVMLCAMQLRGGHLPYPFKWLLVLSLLLLIDPFSVISSSLWMSMYAVACVMVCVVLIPRHWHWVTKAVCAQLVIVVAMAPLVSWLFQGMSLAAFLNNLLLVPWFSWIVIPYLFFATLMTLLLGNVGEWWPLMDALLTPLDWALKNASWGWWTMSHHQFAMLVLAITLVVMLLLFSRLAIMLALFLALSLLFSSRTKPNWVMDMLDVGHGLAVVIRQDSRALVYDTGAAWGSGSIAEQIITPYLIKHGIEHVDWLIASHMDNDHAGGWDYLNRRWQPRNTMSSQHGVGKRRCIAGEQWAWGHLTLEVLWPTKLATRAFNPHSCVIRIHDPQLDLSVLLTGDIETIAEWLLIRKGGALHAEIMTVPHHGSRTSSLAPFIERIQPALALASTEKNGRWRLPHPLVVARYQQLGAEWLDSGSEGQVTVKFYSDRYNYSTLRQRKGGSWYRQMLRKGVE